MDPLVNPAFANPVFGSCSGLDHIPLQFGLDLGGASIYPAGQVRRQLPAQGEGELQEERDWHEDDDDEQEEKAQTGVEASLVFSHPRCLRLERLEREEEEEGEEGGAEKSKKKKKRQQQQQSPASVRKRTKTKEGEIDSEGKSWKKGVKDGKKRDDVVASGEEDENPTSAEMMGRRRRRKKKKKIK